MLKIFNCPWHIAHQYELYKIPNTEWYHIINPYRKWSDKKKSFRPKPANVFEVTKYEPGKYDLALLHIDQQCIKPGLGKSRLYRDMNEAIKDIPKIVINHGTPFWPEEFTDEYIKMQMRQLLVGNHVVVNSDRAAEMWGPLGKSTTTIIHGLDPDEWFDRPKEPRVITTLSGGGLDRYYNRELLLAVKDKLKQKGIQHCWVSHDWIAADFDDYRDFISRSLLYFNPTLESPMPRSRTEAMFSGACVLTLPNHGAEKFIEHGKNGIHVPNNPEVIANLIEELLNNYNWCVKVGQAGKETAKKLFHKDRFQAEWLQLIDQVLKGK